MTGTLLRSVLALLLGGAVFSSCTCHRDAEVADSGTGAERGVGFRAEHQGVSLPTVPPPIEMPPTAVFEEPTVTPGLSTTEIPADFPTDVTLMEDAEVAMVNELAGNARNVLVRTEDDPGKMYQYYQDDLRAKGWVLEQQFQADEHSFLGFRKGNTILNMTISKDPKNPGKQLVGVMYQEDQPPPFEEF